MARASSGSPAKAAVTLLLIDDHELLLRGLESFIQGEAPDIRIVGKASTADEGCALAERLAPDVVLLDLDLAGRDGLAVIARLVRNGGPRVLVYTGARDAESHREAMLLGARGVLTKTNPPPDVLKAIRCVAAGELWLDRAAAGELLTYLMNDKRAAAPRVDAGLARLTPREREIVAAICADPERPTKRIASTLNISEHTLRNHLSAIYHKLDIGARAELVSLAAKAKLLP